MRVLAPGIAISSVMTFQSLQFEVLLLTIMLLSHFHTLIRVIRALSLRLHRANHLIYPHLHSVLINSIGIGCSLCWRPLRIVRPTAELFELKFKCLCRAQSSIRRSSWS
jgi:hypothetical protein